ncbi:MAG: biopolymer transporter ExbD [Pseudomonadota bacterium]|nr:biopolymer transporter ExbD [Pseudomonadota bacterium]
MRRRHAEHQDPHIDVVPLIDCILVLLIFFMVTTTFAKDAELQIERPGAKSATPASSKALRVFIDRSLNIYVNEAPVRPWMLQSRVRDALGTAGDKTVLVVTDRRVSAEKLVEVVDQCRLAGAKDIGVVTDIEDG